MDFKISFINGVQRDFFNDPRRNICVCGGFGSGKTYIALKKLFFLSLAFNKYRCVVARQIYKDLLNTTFKTFSKICDPSLIQNWNETKGYMRLINGSEILWMHLDDFDEQVLKGLEINSVYVDQPEEIQESIYTVLDSRVGRWDKAYPNPKFPLPAGVSFEKNAFGNYIVPNFMYLTPNPDSEDHWIWRYYHPDSPGRIYNYGYYEVASTDNPALNAETLKIMLSRDPSWVKRFVYGKWGISDILLHRVLPDSIIDVSKEWIENLIHKSNCYRVLDHGDSSPTVCLWFLVHKDWHICYREYYVPNATVKTHRESITALSKNEFYVANYADPQIFRPTMQKYGGFWTIAQEYTDPDLHAPPLAFVPADNNELATRNRINDLLNLDDIVEHPINKAKPAPRLYFVKKSRNHEYGCENAILELKSQKRIKIGEVNGKPIFSDDRDMKVQDHAYDPIRYYVAMRIRGPRERAPEMSPRSFLSVRNQQRLLKAINNYDKYGDRVPASARH